MKPLSNILALSISLSTALQILADSEANKKIQRIRSEVYKKLEPELKSKKQQFGNSIFLRIFKKEAILEVWMKNEGKDFELFKEYKICSFSGTLGPKEKQGDGQAPEGYYQIHPHSFNPNSAYHLSFNVGYPNKLDRSLGRTGSAIMVHGNCVSIGCFAMGDKAIEEIYMVAKEHFKNDSNPIPFLILPFKNTKENSTLYRSNRWAPLWQELATISDFFDRARISPNVIVDDGHYKLASTDSDQCKKILKAAQKMIHDRIRYIATYEGLPYPQGDVHASQGVCTDVIVRGLRSIGWDLQKLIFEDKRKHPTKYPVIGGYRGADANIDHRRVPNIMEFLNSKNFALPATKNPSDYRPCDIVAWDLGNGLKHIGLVSDQLDQNKHPLVIHHLPMFVREDNFLFNAPIIGHYRIFKSE